ncbi:hypothetical protein HPP92_023173 [Vanilla planifolia]|uniref:Gnk2-homologous domain-containing protein n=1 Tax=Vanilla planifolia TaxID=51239 RepID=A0A835UGF8_VANPL|nr:hypothetical protein HPP92_023173 [Vanilla planifolia]
MAKKAKRYLFLLLLILSSALTAADETTGYVYVGCSLAQYTPGSAYDLNVNSLFSSLSNAAAFSLYSKFTASAATPSPPIEGLYQCRGDLSLRDCSSCVASAVSRLPPSAPAAAAAELQLDSCFLRYGNDSFLGRPDTGLRYKTCSTTGNGVGAAEFLSSRDQAFAFLAVTPPTGSTYRTVAFGVVSAEAQCDGDLSSRDCSDCISAAASQVKVSCNGAAAGEAYLGKCDIRYSSSGGTLPSSSVDGGGGSSGKNNGDENEKSLAIIIGVIALVALIIICLSFVRKKAFGKK